MDNATEQTTGTMTPDQILGFAGKAQKGRRAEEFNPLETIPTLGVGDLKKGQLLCGTYVGAEVIASNKFKYAREKNEKGVPQQTRYVLENDGKKWAIWQVGELKLIFSKVVIGQYVEITYQGLEMVNDTEQHHFTQKREN